VLHPPLPPPIRGSGGTAHHGIHDLRFASAGRLLGRIDPDRDMLDMAAFATDAEDCCRGALRAALHFAAWHYGAALTVTTPVIGGISAW
jgi:hypothetical protein